jgi:hypothetical protein
MIGGAPMPFSEPHQESEKSDKYLDVDHVWQLDPEHKIPEDQRRTICAIACMKIVIDYVLPEEASKISLKEMYTKMKASGAQNENSHWKHSDQVDYFKGLGLTSWRRNWEAAGSDPSWLADNEGYDSSQVAMVEKQVGSEATHADNKEKSLLSLSESFEADMPVVASVKPGFSTNKQDHQIVLNGMTTQEGVDYLYFTDPVQDPEVRQEKQKVTVERFFEFFNYRAIFVSKPQDPSAQ